MSSNRLFLAIVVAGETRPEIILLDGALAIEDVAITSVSSRTICGEDLGSVVRVSSHGDRRSNEGDQGPQSEDEQLADKEYFYLAYEIESGAEQTTQVREVH